MIPYLILTDKNGNAYSFPTTMMLAGGGIKASVNTKKHANADGGKQTGDARYEPRVITISGRIIAANQAEFETAYMAMSGAVVKGGTLRVMGDSVDRVITVEAPDIDWEYDNYYQVWQVTVTFVAAYPFWEDTDYNEDVNVLAGNDTFTVDASDSIFVINPIIQILADQGADIPSVKLRNTTDGSMYFVFNDPFFTENALFEMDCIEGTIRLNSNDHFEYLVEPSAFLRLQPLSNSFDYEGNACTITIKYKKAYPV